MDQGVVLDGLDVGGAGVLAAVGADPVFVGFAHGGGAAGWAVDAGDDVGWLDVICVEVVGVVCWCEVFVF